MINQHFNQVEVILAYLLKDYNASKSSNFEASKLAQYCNSGLIFKTYTSVYQILSFSSSFNQIPIICVNYGHSLKISKNMSIFEASKIAQHSNWYPHIKQITWEDIYTTYLQFSANLDKIQHNSVPSKSHKLKPQYQHFIHIMKPQD